MRAVRKRASDMITGDRVRDAYLIQDSAEVLSAPAFQIHPPGGTGCLCARTMASQTLMTMAMNSPMLT